MNSYTETVISENSLLEKENKELKSILSQLEICSQLQEKFSESLTENLVLRRLIASHAEISQKDKAARCRRCGEFSEDLVQKIYDVGMHMGNAKRCFHATYNGRGAPKYAFPRKQWERGSLLFAVVYICGVTSIISRTSYILRQDKFIFAF